MNPNDVDINALFEVVVTTFNKSLDPHWYVDICTFQYDIGNSDMVNKLQKLNYPSIVNTARGQFHPIESIGNIHFETPNGIIKTINNVLYVPRFEKNLLSVKVHGN